jgi:hypothetical protein
MAEPKKPTESFLGVPSLDKDRHGYGVNSEGVLCLNESDDKGNLKPRWICDGYARISEEMRRDNGDAVFIIEGRGAKDGHIFKFEMNAYDFSESRKLRGKLTAQFGASNQLGGLSSNVIQEISRDIKKFHLIETPRWVNGKAAVTGLDLIPHLRYAANPRVPVDVSTGNLSDAQKSLSDLLTSWDPKLTTVAYAAILGAPIVARWYPGDRFGLFIRGLTGMGKTEFLKNAMGTFGQGYLNEDNLMRRGAGSTTNALMKIAATSGFLPFLTDNYKPLKRDDEANLIGMIQAVLEGSDKARLTSDSEFKESLKFACTLLITGEDFPLESSTMARCLVLDWSPIHSPARLSNAQNLAHNLPALGREWFTWLSANEATIEAILEDFESQRSKLYKELVVLENAVNPGRLSTNLTLLRSIWKVALECPALAEVLEPHDHDFEEGIEMLIKRAPAETIAANEAVDFVDTLNELIGTGRAKLAPNDGFNISGRSDIVGWIRPDGEVCIFPKTARNLTNLVAPTLQKISANSLYKQLDERGFIETDEAKGERTLIRKFNGKASRVLVFKKGMIGGDQ